MAIKLLNPEDVAEITSTNTRLVIRLTKEGKIKGALKFGGRWKYNQEVFEKWLKSKSQQSSHRILAVDDEPGILKILNGIVQEMGHECITAAGGQDALDLLKTDRKFSLIILDLLMPNVDGVDILRWLSKHGVDIPVLIYSGQVDAQIYERALKYNFFTVVKKPSKKDELKRAIDFCLKGVIEESA